MEHKQTIVLRKEMSRCSPWERTRISLSHLGVLLAAWRN